MPLPSQTLPTIGAPNSTEDVKIRNCLLELQTILTGGVDATNVLANTFATLVDLQQLAHGALQSGVYGAGDLMVTQRSAGANMSVDVAAGTAWILSPTSGLLVRVTTAASTNVPVTTANATNPRVDQVAIDTTGTISVLAGTPTAGATLDNAAGTTSRAAIPTGSLRLGEFVVAAASSSVSNSSVRDRRPWARGAFSQSKRTSGNITVSNVTTLAEIDTSALKPRLELTGAPLRITFTPGYIYAGTAPALLDLQVFIDGAAHASSPRIQLGLGATADQLTPTITFDLVGITPGSRRVSIGAFRTTNNVTLSADATWPAWLTVEELVRQEAENNSVTTG